MSRSHTTKLGRRKQRELCNAVLRRCGVNPGSYMKYKQHNEKLQKEKRGEQKSYNQNVGNESEENNVT